MGKFLNELSYCAHFLTFIISLHWQIIRSRFTLEKRYKIIQNYLKNQSSICSIYRRQNCVSAMRLTFGLRILLINKISSYGVRSIYNRPCILHYIQKMHEDPMISYFLKNEAEARITFNGDR